MYSPKGLVIRSDNAVYSTDHEHNNVTLHRNEQIVTLTPVNDTYDQYRNIGERRLRDEAIAGYQHDKRRGLSMDASPPSIWFDIKMFVSFVLSFSFGIVLPFIQIIIGGIFFGACYDGNTFSVFLVVGALLDIAGSSTFVGLVQRTMEKDDLSRDPHTECAKRVWNCVCALGIVAWIVIGQWKIYHLTYNRNPFQRGLPCVMKNGLVFHSQIFIAIKLVAIAIGLSLAIVNVLLKKESLLCWRKYSLKNHSKA